MYSLGGWCADCWFFTQQIVERVNMAVAEFLFYCHRPKAL